MSFKQKIVFTLASLLILLVAIWIFVIRPTIREIKKISDAVYRQRVMLEEKYIKGQTLKKTMEDFKQIQPQIPSLSSIFLQKGNELKYITKIEEMAGQNQIDSELQLNTKTMAPLKDVLENLPFTLILKGDFVSIIKFLTELEKIDYYTNFYSLSLKGAEQNTSPHSSIYSKEPQEQSKTSTFLEGKIYLKP